MNPNDSVQVRTLEPSTGRLELRLGELLRYRDLVWLLIRRDFVARYKQTVLGPAWHVIQPLLMTTIFTVAFGRIAGLSTDGIPAFLFYMSGTILWTYFANVILTTSMTFTANAGVFSKVYFPRLAVPIASSLSALVGFMIQYAIFLALCLWRGVDLNQAALLSVFVVFMLMLFSFAIGLIIASVTIKYRDLAVLVGFGTQLLMYVSPVIYPISSIPERYVFYMNLNPVSPLIEMFRYGHFGQGTVISYSLIFSVVTIALMFLFAVGLFNKMERDFVDTI